MEVISIEPESGKAISTTIPDPDPKFFSMFDELELSDEQVRNQIDRMRVSADVKALLYSFSKATITAGKMQGFRTRPAYSPMT